MTYADGYKYDGSWKDGQRNAWVYGEPIPMHSLYRQLCATVCAMATARSPCPRVTYAASGPAEKIDGAGTAT